MATDLNVTDASCLAAGLLISKDWLITKIGKDCFIWYDYKITNQYHIRFDLPESPEELRGSLIENILSNNWKAVYNYLKLEQSTTTKKKHKKRKEGSRLSSTSNFGIKVSENKSGGTYTVLTDDSKLYVPARYVNQDKLSEDLLRKSFPAFFKFKNYYLSQNEPTNVLLFSASNEFKHSYSSFAVIINVDKIDAVDLTRSKGLLRAAVDCAEEDSSNIKVYISRSNFQHVDKSYLNNIAVHVNINEIE